MRYRVTGAAALAAVVLALAALAGCGRPQATVRYVTGGPDEKVTYDSATFQLARGAKVQIILHRRMAAPLGTADADFEYVYFELPEAKRYGWLREDNVPAYRWIREGGHDRLWRGAAGQMSQRAADSKQHMHFDFRVTMEPVAGTEGGAYVLTGSLRMEEDTVRTQGLINRYGDWMLTLLGEKPKPPPPMRAPSKPKKPAAPAPGAK